jgi:hypothetical protein
LPPLGLGKCPSRLRVERERYASIVESKLDACLGDLEVAGIALNPYVVEAATNRRQPTGATAHKWVKDCVARFSQQQGKVGQQFNGLDAGMVVRVLRLLVQGPSAFIALNQPTLGQVFNPDVSLTRSCLIVRENRGRHLDRAVAQRVLHAKAAVAVLLPMALHRLGSDRFHHKDDVFVSGLYARVVFVANRLAGRRTVGVFPNQPPTDDKANLLKQCRQFVRSLGRAERHHVATGFQDSETFPPDSEAGNAVIPIEIAEVDAIGRIANDRRYTVGQDGFQHLRTVPTFQDSSGANGGCGRQSRGKGGEVGTAVHVRSFWSWTVQVGARGLLASSVSRFIFSRRHTLHLPT